jgi:hypothetical protein
LRVHAVLCCSLAVTACQRSPAPDPHPAAQAPVTFTRDVAPILIQHCATCHRPVDSGNGAAPQTEPASSEVEPVCFAGAPFSLLDYRDARAHAQQIVEATRKRVMPPWLPDSGDPAFIDERRLREDQIEMIRQWVQEGAVEGNTADRPPIPKWPEGWQLGQPDMVLSLPQPYPL